MAAVNEERAQLILVGALGLAVTLVALALILNSVIYTQNLASRSIESGGDKGMKARQDIEAGTGSVIDGMNDPESATDYPNLESNFKSGELQRWNEIASRHRSLEGATVNVEVTGSGTGPDIYRGVRIVDDDPTSAFTPQDSGTLVGTSNTDWVVASDVRVRDMELVVEEGSISSEGTVDSELDDGTPLDGDFFYAELRDHSSGDVEWSVAMYGDGTTTDIEVLVYDHDTDEYSVCTSTPDEAPVSVDFSKGTVNRVSCTALTEIAEDSGRHDIYFANGDKATGTYELTVDRTISEASLSTGIGSFTDSVDRLNYGEDCEGPTYNSPSAGLSGTSPYVVPAMYSADIQLNYRNSDSDYNPLIEVAPEELQSGTGTHPQIESITVTDDSASGTAEFQFEVKVADPDGDFSRVKVALEERSSGTEVDFIEKTTSDPNLNGNGGSITGTLGISGVTLPEEYDIIVTVDDGSNTKQITQYHLADDVDNNGGCPK